MFRPIGDRARWRVLYDLLAGRGVGEVLTYEEMADALGLDPATDRQKIQLAMRRAAVELEVEDKHAVAPVVNTGYRIVEPRQQLGLARAQQGKASAALMRGRSKVVNVDFNMIDPETRRAFQVVAGAFAAQLDLINRLDVRQTDLERVVTTQTERTERTEEELATVLDRLRRLETETFGSGSE